MAKTEETLRSLPSETTRMLQALATALPEMEFKAAAVKVGNAHKRDPETNRPIFKLTYKLGTATIPVEGDSSTIKGALAAFSGHPDYLKKALPLEFDAAVVAWTEACKTKDTIENQIDALRETAKAAGVKLADKGPAS